MFCTQCGSRAEEGDNFCANCGVQLSKSSAESQGVSQSVPNPPSSNASNSTTEAIQAKLPPARVAGRKLLKWSLRVIAFFIAMIVYLAWKELSAKTGMESAAMGAARGIAVFGAYLAFVEWTKSLDVDKSEMPNGEPVARITEQQLATFVGASFLVVVLAYYSAPHNQTPEAVWWTAIIYMAAHAAWLWLFPTKSEEEVRSARRWAIGGILVLFFVVLPTLVETL